MKNVTKTNVLFAATVLVYIILVNVVGLIPKEVLTINMLLVLPEIILLIPSLLYILVLRPKTVDDVTISSVSPGTVLKTLVMTVLLMPLVAFINSISSAVAGNSVDTTLELIVTENPLWLNLIILALLPAVVEEFIFRGLILNGYKKRNPLIAITLSSVLFGLIHMNINQFSYAFVIGFVFGLLAYATGSLLPTILAHFVINGTSITLSHMIGFSNEATAKPAAMEYIIAFAVMGGIAFVGLVLAMKVFESICNKNRGFENVKRIFTKPYRQKFDEEEGKFFDGYLLLGVGVCLFYILVYDILM
ncbi:MAG: CPBP family intramembrane metalloprotease [Lachnospiraceae bacterium]|nr:CPBP family intramembrane metalloprotease [Lachnospiraceae bacterium]